MGRMIMELMEVIQESEGRAERMVLTVLEGEAVSEKALIINGEIVWESRKDGYFRRHEADVKNVTESGIVTFDSVRIFCDTLGQEKRIVICGAGHVSIPVIKIAVMMDCEVIVLEDRPMYADHARQAGASQVICEPFDEALDKIEGSADTYFVILTRGHRYDQICLEKIAQKEHAYIGMIGSRRRTALVKQSLAEKGIDKAVLDAVYTPIGLDIGAQTPAEIGVAIIAEIIEVKNKKKRTYGYSKEIMRALTAPDVYPQQKIMATIVTRHGSAPQGLGTKMLICQDGQCVGTIGGGCMEARVIQIARLMASGENEQPRICHVDMTGNEAEDEGMVCGGEVDVFLEVV
ncbi:XdhC family protein [Dorea sp.]